MYRCRMKIAIFSKDTMLSELVRSLEPLEHFTHEITVAPEANQEIMREKQASHMESGRLCAAL